MTRNSCVSARICGSHICKLQPSEFDSISVGPPSRPSTDTLSRQPSASIIGMKNSPVSLSGERGEQAVDQGLRGALISHRLEQFCYVAGVKLRGDLWIRRQHVAQMFLLCDRLLA